MRIFVSLFIILTFSLIVSGQNSQSKNKSKEVVGEQTVELSSGNRGSRPKLSLQDALKLMEKYIEKEKIDTSKYYLWQVKLFQYGSENEKRDAWHFWWLNEKLAVGDYIQIILRFK